VFEWRVYPRGPLNRGVLLLNEEESIIVSDDLCEFLARHSSQLRELKAREVRTLWKRIHDLVREPHTLELISTLGEHNLAACRTLHGFAARDAYYACGTQNVYVLSKVGLRGWQCQCNSTIPIDTIDHGAVVVPTDYSWYFSHIKNFNTDHGFVSCPPCIYREFQIRPNPDTQQNNRVNRSGESGGS
jgi:hypothetical protein